MWWITSHYLCPFRLFGDVALAASIPVLLFRIVQHGPDGVSLRTQFLHTVVFAMRYLDLFYHASSRDPFMIYNDLIRAFYLFGSVLLVLVLGWKKYTQPRIASTAKIGSESSGSLEVMLMITGSILLGLRFNYLPNVTEVLWSSSQFLSIFAELPQLVVTYGAQKRDVGVYIYLGCIAAFRTFYVPHYILRYMSDGIFDRISVPCAAAQLCVLYTGFALLAIQKYPAASIAPYLGQAEDVLAPLNSEYTDDDPTEGENAGKDSDLEVV